MISPFPSTYWPSPRQRPYDRCLGKAEHFVKHAFERVTHTEEILRARCKTPPLFVFTLWPRL